MPLYENGPTTPYSAMNAGVLPNDVFGVAINWFINRTPLTSRLPHSPVDSTQFLITNDNYRPRTDAVQSNPLAQAGVTLAVLDGSAFEAGDVIQIEDEFLLITGVSGNNLTVTRGYAGSADVAHVKDKPVYLITNTRTGAEVDVTGISRVPSAVTQYVQTIQHAYAVGGSMQAKKAYATSYATPLDRDRMLAIQHTMDDFESAAYYGKGSPITGATSRPLMKGLSTLLTSNKTTSPTNANSYKPSDLVRDTVQKCFDGGGQPNLLLVSTDFLQAFTIWGQAAMRINAGENVFGAPIDLFEVPFLGGISIIPAPLLRPKTAVCLSLPEARIRLSRTMIDKPRGSRGDAFEGDIIMEGAIEIDNEAHHAWVQGITGFSA